MLTFPRFILTGFIILLGCSALSAVVFAQAPQPISIPGETQQPPVATPPKAQQSGPTIFQIIEQVVTRYIPITVTPQCPSCPQAKNICTLKAQDTADLRGNFDLSYECEGVFAPCSITATVGSADPRVGEVTHNALQNLEGAGSFGLNLGVAPAVTYKILDQSGTQCGFSIAHALQTGQAPITIAGTPVLAQTSYRWFADNDAATPTVALQAQDTTHTANFADGNIVRLRLAIDVTNAALSSGGAVLGKLQIAEAGLLIEQCVGVAYSDVPDPLAGQGTGPAFIFHNGTPADGAATADSGGDPTANGALVYQTYEEVNNFSVANAISAGSAGLWDFALEYDAGGVGKKEENDWFARSSLYRFIAKILGNVGIRQARAGEGQGGTLTTYCFRVVKQDGVVLDTYTSYPMITHDTNL